MNHKLTLNKCFFWIAMGSLCCICSVAIGAFAAHGLQNILSAPNIELIETGARYQMFHGLAIILVALIQLSVNRYSFQEQSKKELEPQFYVLSCNIYFLLGILFFSGSLYALSIQRGWFASLELPRLIYLITPLGGMLLLFAWCLLVFKCLKSRNSLA